MLTSYLKSGQTVDFAIVSSRGVTSPAIEMLMTGHDMQRIGTIKLTPLEALTLADDLKRVSDYVCGVRDNVYTPSTENIQTEESLLNLHPRSAVLLANADLNPATGEHNDRGRTGGETPISADDLPHSFDGGRDDEAARGGGETVGGNGHPVRAGLRDGGREAPMALGRSDALAQGGEETATGLDQGRYGLIVDSQGHVAKQMLPPPPAVIIVEPVEGEPGFAEYWLKKTGRMEDNANQVMRGIDEAAERMAGLPDGTNVPVSAALNDDDDAWADSVDWFVDAIQLDIDSIKIDREANTMWMDVVQSAEGQPDAKMPLTLTARPALIKSSSTRQLIEEVFAQGFRYGASWENCREDQP